MHLLNNSLLFSIIMGGAAFAQTISIGAPPDGTTVKAGSTITVQVDHPLPLLTPGSIEASIVIGFQSRASSSSPAPGDPIGDILYNGPFNPVLHLTGIGPGNHGPFENFNVTIPESASAGAAQLSVTHVNLAEPGPRAVIENVAISLVVY
ncbi:hypothetical protein FB451DRAFT_1102672 [Mycena latifolia]|nr:hypothetical protein FB451DRAFT_1102672 [Mycena latifolia]